MYIMALILKPYGWMTQGPCLALLNFLQKVGSNKITYVGYSSLLFFLFLFFFLALTLQLWPQFRIRCFVLTKWRVEWKSELVLARTEFYARLLSR